MLGTVIEQLDFSGGVNITDDPADLKPTELSDALNVRLASKSTVEQRKGFTAYNSTAITSTPTVTSLYQFRDYLGNLIPVCQCGGAVYKGTTAFPGTITTWTSLFSETAGYGTGVMDDMWGRLIYTNNKDVPKTYEGTYSKCYGFYKTIDTAANFIDYTGQVSDEYTVTYAQIGGLLAATTDYLIIKARVPKIKGIRLVIDGTYKNSESSTVTISYRSSVGAWTTVGTVTDGTRPASATMAQTGDMTFTECTCVLDTIGGIFGYWLKVSTNTSTLSADVRILGAYIMYDIQDLPNFWEGSYFLPSGFKKTLDTDVTYLDRTSVVVDGSLATSCTLASFPVTTGFFYIQSPKKFRGARISMGGTLGTSVNTTISTLSAQYWDGTTWQTLTITDGTRTGSGGTARTLAQSSLITWTWPADAQIKKLVVDDFPSYQVRFAVSATLSTNVEISEIELLEITDSLIPHKFCIYHKNRLFLVNRPDGQNYLFYSAAFKPDVFNGSDTGYIGIPSGKPITAVHRFYNELFVATADEIYLLQGYSPQTFGLLQINTGGIGVISHFSCVGVGRFLFFAHSTGFYKFDGIGITLISKQLNFFFDNRQPSYFIPITRLEYIQGRFDRIHSCIEWSVSKGSAQTTNNCICCFDIEQEGWWFDNIAAASLLKTTGASYEDLLYHGDYAGKVHQDWTGTTDNTVAISAYVTTRGFGRKDILNVFRAVGTMMQVETAGDLVVTYAKSGSTSFTSYGTLSPIRVGYTYTWQDLYVPVFGQSLVFKFLQETSGATFTMTGVRVEHSPIRAYRIQT